LCTIIVVNVVKNVTVPLVKFALNCWIACAFYHTCIHLWISDRK